MNITVTKNVLGKAIYDNLKRTVRIYSMDPDEGTISESSKIVASLSLSDCKKLAEILIGDKIFKGLGVELLPLASNPGDVPENTIWISSVSGHVYRGTVDLELGIGGIVNAYNKTPSGIINGLNKVFTTIEDFVLNTTRLYLNGLKNRLNIDYMESGENTIVMDEAPRTGDSLRISYVIK